MLKIFTAKKIADLVGCSRTTVLVYISRAEFSHVQVIKMQRM